MPNEFLILSAFLLFEALFLCTACIAIILKTPAVELFRDLPGSRKVHQRQIARAGGVCMILSFILTLLSWRLLLPDTAISMEPGLFDIVIFSAVCVLAIGLTDDLAFLSISNGAKFLLEVVLAWVVVAKTGIGLGHVHLFGLVLNLGIWNTPFSILWIVGVANAINLIDGIDGLAGTLAIVIVTGILALAVQSSAYAVALFCMPVIGVAAGFLFFNHSPAKIFLGDSGSLFLGVFIGMLSLTALRISDGRVSIIILLLLVGVPIIDVFTAMVRRYVRKVRVGGAWHTAFGAMFKPDNEHLHHRLIQHGLSHNQAVLTLSLFSATLTACAVILVRATEIYSVITMLYVLASVVAFLYMLDFFETPKALLRSLISKQGVPDRKGRISIAAIDLDPALTYALSHYEQRQFAFVSWPRSDLFSQRDGITGILIANNDPEKLGADWAAAQQAAMDRKCPVLIISSSMQSPYMLPMARMQRDENPRARVIFIKNPVYIPVLLKRLETVLKRGFTEKMENFLKETQKLSTGLVHHERARQKQATAVGH